jgi:hypothetical protein
MEFKQQVKEAVKAAQADQKEKADKHNRHINGITNTINNVIMVAFREAETEIVNPNYNIGVQAVDNLKSNLEEMSASLVLMQKGTQTVLKYAFERNSDAGLIVFTRGSDVLAKDVIRLGDVSKESVRSDVIKLIGYFGKA